MYAEIFRYFLLTCLAPGWFSSDPSNSQNGVCYFTPSSIFIYGAGRHFEIVAGETLCAEQGTHVSTERAGDYTSLQMPAMSSALYPESKASIEKITMISTEQWPHQS